MLKLAHEKIYFIINIILVVLIVIVVVMSCEVLGVVPLLYPHGEARPSIFSSGVLACLPLWPIIQCLFVYHVCAHSLYVL